MGSSSKPATVYSSWPRGDRIIKSSSVPKLAQRVKVIWYQEYLQTLRNAERSIAAVRWPFDPLQLLEEAITWWVTSGRPTKAEENGADHQESCCRSLFKPLTPSHSNVYLWVPEVTSCLDSWRGPERGLRKGTAGENNCFTGKRKQNKQVTTGRGYTVWMLMWGWKSKHDGFTQ